MKSKRSHEGYLLVDHRNSPGLSEADTLAAGRPIKAARGLFEAPAYRCNHCQVVVVINPARSRDREWCSKCNHYICDACGAVKAYTNQCRSIARIIEEIQEAAARA